MTRRSILMTACGLGALAAAGCVQPGEIDANLLTRYQQAVVGRSPQQRVDSTGLGLLTPAAGADLFPLDISTDPETGRKIVRLTLEQAVRLALANSLDIQIVSFEPALSRELVLQAAAAFDFVVYANVSNGYTDQHSSSTVAMAKTQTTPFQAGVRNQNVLGGSVELAYSMTRENDNSPFTAPDPRYESVLSIQITQPLLRFGGLDYNLAAVRLARVSSKTSYAMFRQKVEEVLAQTEVVYWSLIQARLEMEIQQMLLDKTIETLDRVRKREKIDATQVVIKQSEAAVETRRAGLIRARKTIYDIQDQLLRIVADPRLLLADDFDVIAVTPPVQEKVVVDVTDQLVTAFKYSPVLEQARLAVAGSAISVIVAENERLPILNFVANAGIQGLKGKQGTAFREMRGSDFLSHSVGLAFEYPLGNREAEAKLSQRRLERLKTIAQMQNFADQLALNVKDVGRQVETSYEEVQAQATALAASRIELQSLEALEKSKEQMTPEFLQVKLQSQERLAQAARSHIEAIVRFNNALAQLSQTTGTILHRHNVRLLVEQDVAGMAPAAPAAPEAETRPAPAAE